MSENTQIIDTTGEIIATDDFSRASQRQIAALLLAEGDNEIYVEAIGAKMSQKKWLAIMVWDFITTGSMHFADGNLIRIGSFEQWMGMVKFLSTHIDGPASRDMNLGVNIFKVYNGIDVDKI